MTAIDTHDPSHEGHDHEHPPFLAHHFDTPKQQFEAAKLGMWLFLATEFLLFGGLFCAYAVMRFNHPELFEYGSRFLNTKLGAINTVVLIVSSLTMAMAVTAAQLGKTRALVILLGLTFLGGAGFMGIKYVEYSHKFHYNYEWGRTLYVPPAEHDEEHGEGAEDGAHVTEEHLDAEAHEEPAVAAEEAPPAELIVDGVIMTQSAVVAPGQAPAGLAQAEVVEVVQSEPDPRTDPERPENAHIFFGIYFLMTGLHGIHVLAGMGVIAWLMVLSIRGRFGPAYFTPVDLGGLYWHVVDLIWIFLFPLLYLIA